MGRGSNLTLVLNRCLKKQPQILFPETPFNNGRCVERSSIQALAGIHWYFLMMACSAGESTKFTKACASEGCGELLATAMRYWTMTLNGSGMPMTVTFPEAEKVQA